MSKIFASGGADEPDFVKFSPHFTPVGPLRRRIKRGSQSWSRIQEDIYEYDAVILSSQHKEIVVVELKGYKATSIIRLGDSTKKNTVKWFFRKTLPAIQAAYARDGYNITGAYIATCGFDEPAVAFMSELMKSKLKPAQMDVFYDRDKLILMLEVKNLVRIRNLIDRYYI